MANAVRSLFLFMMVSLDGYFEGPNRDLSWHVVDEEFNRFAVDQLNEIGTLLFGRVTYHLFEDYWPKAGRDPTMSRENLEIAQMIDDVEKIVFSRTLAKVKEVDGWRNVRLIREAQPEEIKRLKQLPGKDIAIFGSNDLATNLLRMGLIDELRIMVNPVILGNGNPLFRGMTDHVKLKLLRTKTFRSGNVLHYYQPSGRVQLTISK
jgi:dihydrofolate reductase